MNILITKSWKPLLSLLFGVAVMLFWAVPYMAGLCFQEQYQMFLFDTNYISCRTQLLSLSRCRISVAFCCDGMGGSDSFLGNDSVPSHFLEIFR